MAQQVINVGAAPNDGQGDPIRTAYIKCNNNFDQLYSRVQTSPPPTLIGSIGDQAGMYAYDSTYFYYCYADYDGSSQIWNQVQNAGNVSATQISFGSTNVDIPIPSGNVIFTVANVEVATFNTGGVRISGFGNVIGNLVASNIHSPGEISATGNVIGDHVIAIADVSATGNITGGNYFTAGFVTATGNIEGNYILGNGSLLTGLPETYANSNVQAYLPTYTGNLVALTGNVTTTANVNANNLSATSNVIAGNIRTAGVVTATGNITGGNVLTAGQVSATGNITGAFFTGNGAGLTGVIAVANVGAATQVANGTTSFNIPTADGNLIGNISGSTFVYVFTNTGVNVAGYVTATANITGGNLRTGGLISATGNIVTAANMSANSIYFAGSVSGVGNIFTNGTVIAGGNLSAGGNVTVTNVFGTTVSATGNITGGNLITSGSLSVNAFSAVGNISGGNIISAGLITSAGNVTAGNINTGGIVLAVGNITGQNLNTGQQVVALGNVTGANVRTSGLITATGNIQGGNIRTVGTVSATGNVIGNYFIGNGSQLTGIDTTLIQSGTSNVKLVSANGNATVNINGTANVAVFANTGQYVTGIISATGNILGGNIIQGGVRVYKWTTQANTAPSNAVAGDEWYDSYTDKLYKYINDGTGNQWVDQSFPSTFGTLAVTGAATIGGTLGVTGNITAGNFVTTGAASVTSIIKTGSNAVGNIGSSSNYFNTIFAQATSAQYADLAEHYQADADYVPGTVVVFGGDKEVTVSDISHDTRVAGVVSTSPAYLMNAGNPGVIVALVGRVPCLVQGPVAKGDRLVNLANGVAGKLDQNQAELGCVIGKSLENIDDSSVSMIEIAVGRT